MKEFTRQSKQRDAILTVLKNTTSHPDANWIYHKVREIIPNISLGTVYRNLKELSERGIIVEIIAKDNVKNYDGNVKKHNHFVCEQCGKISDIHDYVEEEFSIPSHIINNVSIVFYGVCPHCNIKN